MRPRKLSEFYDNAACEDVSNRASYAAASCISNVRSEVVSRFHPRVVTAVPIVLGTLRPVCLSSGCSILEVLVGSPIQFQRIAESDGPAFYELRRSAIRAGCVGYYTPAQIDAWTNPLTDMGLQTPLPQHFYFAKIDGEIVGCCSFDVATGRIDGMAVSPSHFRRGIGRAMMQHLENAKDFGVQLLTLDASLNSVDFYRSQGFQGAVVGSYQSPRGITLECVPMSKSLVVA